VFAFNHAGNNAFSDSSRPAVPGDETHGGLSALGEQAVRTLNDRGVLIDVSQITPRALMQTVALSRAPVIASHSAVRALVDETRNLLDEELEAIGANGGVVQRIGIDHVGIGTDFDHGAGIIGFGDASEAQNLTRALLVRGYSEDDIAKIWSGNFMRVLRAAEAIRVR
jgi:membrane dipeptidase